MPKVPLYQRSSIAVDRSTFDKNSGHLCEAYPAPREDVINGCKRVRPAQHCHADAVLVGSGIRTREVVADAALMAQMRFDPTRQLLGAQCSGTLILSKLGLLDGVPACTDLTTRAWVEEAGVAVLNQPFAARRNIATAGGCL